MNLPGTRSGRQRPLSLWLTAIVICVLLGVTWAAPSWSSSEVSAARAHFQLTVSPIIVSATPTWIVFCSPPACQPDEQYYCPGTCPGGCGTECATRTPTATVPPPRAPASSGALIELRLLFPALGPGVTWQELWTIVQWQDAFGRWHDVEGWRGTLDSVDRDGTKVIGRKTWWLANDLFGKGPFRWTVYRADGSALVSDGEPFLLPDFEGEVKIVEVSP